jgi:sugar O-acyltransferase (sialic acid O-acetyltransferase NeuD family)
VIVGAGGHGREVLDVVEAMNQRESAFEVLGFLDDTSDGGDVLARRGVGVVGTVADLASAEADYLVAIGSPEVRRRVDSIAAQWGLRAAIAVHPSATIGSDIVLGPGSVVTAGVRLTTNIRLGRHVHLNVNATVSHDCRLDDYVTVNPGARACGNVTLGEGVTLGAGATVIPGRTVGAWTVVGAGAVVVHDLPARVTAVGVPARPRPAGGSERGATSAAE